MFGDYEATQFEFSLYGMLHQSNEDRQRSIDLAKEIFAGIKSLAIIVDYKKNPGVEKDMRRTVYDILKSDMEHEQIMDTTEKVVTLVRNRL